MARHMTAAVLAATALLAGCSGRSTSEPAEPDPVVAASATGQVSAITTGSAEAIPTGTLDPTRAAVADAEDDCPGGWTPEEAKMIADKDVFWTNQDFWYQTEAWINAAAEPLSRTRRSAYEQTQEWFKAHPEFSPSPPRQDWPAEYLVLVDDYEALDIRENLFKNAAWEAIYRLLAYADCYLDTAAQDRELRQ